MPRRCLWVTGTSPVMTTIERSASPGSVAVLAVDLLDLAGGLPELDAGRPFLAEFLGLFGGGVIVGRLDPFGALNVPAAVDPVGAVGRHLRFPKLTDLENERRREGLRD